MTRSALFVSLSTLFFALSLGFSKDARAQDCADLRDDPIGAGGGYVWNASGDEWRVSGPRKRREFEALLRDCGYEDAAEGFADWRLGRKRQSWGIFWTAGVWVTAYGIPVSPIWGIPMWITGAKKARHGKEEMLEALNDVASVSDEALSERR